MNIFSRFWTAIKSHINALLDRLEDPEDVLNQSIRDMQSQVDRLRKDVVTVIAEEKRLKGQLDKQQSDVERWEKNAMLALKEGNETLAREALKRKREAAEYTQQLRPQWDQQKEIASRLKSEYHGLRDRIESAQRKKRTLVARMRRAETQKKLQGLLTDLSDNSVFEKMEGKILDTEFKLEAQEELQESSLDEKFKELESAGGGDLDVEQELEAMKQKLELNE